MGIDYTDFFETAKTLASSSSEADMRSAISRAYYSVLHGTLAALPPDRQPDSNFRGGSHDAVIASAKGYGNANPPLPGRQAACLIAEKLGRLKYRRKTADYSLTTDVDQETTKRVIQEAKIALDHCAEWIDRRAGAAA
jgi:uncharacterized protein (UPF0332 family)